MTDWLTREQVTAALKDAQMAPPYQDRGIMAKDAVKLFRMALAALDAHADKAAEVEKLEGELVEQARLLGMGGEREAKLMAEVAALRERIRGMEGALKGANEQLRMALHMENGSWRKHVADAIRNLKQAKAAQPQPCQPCQTCGGKGYETHALGWMPRPDCKPQQKEGPQ